MAAAEKLLLRNGYAATGINDICREAGVSKGAFYHFFPSKEDLALAALDGFFRRGVEVLASIDVSGAPPAERLPLFVERLAEHAGYLWGRGCLIGDLATEMAQVSDTLQRRVAKQFGQLTGKVAQLAEPYVTSLPPGAPSAGEVAEDLLALIEGTLVLSRAHRDQERIGAALRRHAEGLRLLQRRRGLPRSTASRA